MSGVLENQGGTIIYSPDPTDVGGGGEFISQLSFGESEIDLQILIDLSLLGFTKTHKFKNVVAHANPTINEFNIGYNNLYLNNIHFSLLQISKNDWYYTEIKNCEIVRFVNNYYIANNGLKILNSKIKFDGSIHLIGYEYFILEDSELEFTIYGNNTIDFSNSLNNSSFKNCILRGNYIELNCSMQVENVEIFNQFKFIGDSGIPNCNGLKIRNCMELDNTSYSPFFNNCEFGNGYPSYIGTQGIFETPQFVNCLFLDSFNFYGIKINNPIFTNCTFGTNIGFEHCEFEFSNVNNEVFSIGTDLSGVVFNSNSYNNMNFTGCIMSDSNINNVLIYNNRLYNNEQVKWTDGLIYVHDSGNTDLWILQQ